MNSKDIAKIAGVSRSTVSRVVNGYSNVPSETKKKVMEVINEYGYVPNSSARALAGKQNRIIGLFIVDTSKNVEERIVASPYFSDFIASVVECANKIEYNVLVSVVTEEEDYQKVSELFNNKMIGGGIFVGVEKKVEAINALSEKGYKIVIIDQKGDEKNTIYINSNNINGSYKAVKYLIEQGHKDIVHLAGDPNKISGVERKEGYIKAMIEGGLIIDEKSIYYGNFTDQSGYDIAKKILKDKIPNAMFVANDTMALSAMRAIREEGLRVPEDISIIGYDGTIQAENSHPKITTVKMPIYEMASLAVNHLAEAIKEKMMDTESYLVDVELKIGESVTKKE